MRVALLAILFFSMVTLVSYARADTRKAPIVTVTAFTLSHNECGGRIKKTSIMTKPVPGRTAAVSRDMLHLLGKRVYVEGFGMWKIESVMAKHKRKSIDLLVPSKRIAHKIGRSKRRIVVI